MVKLNQVILHGKMSGVGPGVAGLGFGGKRLKLVVTVSLLVFVAALVHQLLITNAADEDVLDVDQKQQVSSRDHHHHHDRSSCPSWLAESASKFHVEVSFDRFPPEAADRDAETDVAAAELKKYISDLDSFRGRRKWSSDKTRLPLYEGHHVFEQAGNQSVTDYIAEQQHACFLNKSRPFYRVRSAVYPMPNRTESELLLKQGFAAKKKKVEAPRRIRVGCVVTGLMRSYQEVYKTLAEVIFLPTNCDVFVSTDALRGFSQIRFALDESAKPYDGLEQEIAWEVVQTHLNATTEVSAQRLRQRAEKRRKKSLQNGSDENNEIDEDGEEEGYFGADADPKSRRTFLSVNVAPMAISAARSFSSLVSTKPRAQALPIYRHMLVALSKLLRRERDVGQMFDVIFQLRPDLVFQYSTQFHVVSSPSTSFVGQEDVFLVRDGVVVLLSNQSLVVNGRISGPNRANDHLTIGLRDPMVNFLRSYYFFKHVSTDELHSEVAKKIVLMHWGYSVCGLHLRVESLKHRARGYHGHRIHFTNSRFCFRNCSFVDTFSCRSSFVDVGGNASAAGAHALALPASTLSRCSIAAALKACDVPS